MDAGFRRACDGRLYRGKIAADPAVESLLPALEVDVHRIDVRQETRKWFGADHAVRDEHDGKPRRVQEGSRVHDVLDADERLVVRKGNAEIAARLMAQLLCKCGEPCGRDVLRLDLVICHGDVRVLAEWAGKIAAEAADGEDAAAGVKMVERLLLNRIEREGGEPPVVLRADDTSIVPARAAEARFARAQTAGMGAEGAGEAPVRSRMCAACAVHRLHRPRCAARP